jgi:hypothetical protein
MSNPLRRPRHPHRASALGLVLIFAALMLGVCLPASAGNAKRHDVSIEGSDAIVERGTNFVRVAGVVRGRPIRRGAIVQRVSAVSPPGETTSSFTIFTKSGTISGTGRSTRTPQPDGSVQAVGSRTVKSGTGAYKGARGRLRMEGVTRAGISTFRWTGTIRY